MNIFITGTSSGLGYGLAKFYLKNGDKVYGLSRRRNKELESYKNFYFLQLDLNDFSAIRSQLKLFFNVANKLDLVILNAGILNEIKDLKDTRLDEIEAVMKTNVWANKILIDTLFQADISIHQVVGISSGASVSGSRGFNAYALSKATLNAMIKTYAGEFTETHFAALAPGLIDTQMQDYIKNLENVTDFPAIEKLQQAKGTSEMPLPDQAGKLIAEAITKLKAYESGQFVDVRKM